MYFLAMLTTSRRLPLLGLPALLAAGYLLGATLLSARFKNVLKQLAASYEWVVFDTPPIMAVADATLIAPAGPAPTMAT